MVLLAILLVVGCKSNGKAAEAQSTPASNAQAPAVAQMEKPTETAKASAPPLKSSPDLQTLNPYSLDNIQQILKADQTVFNITESPNKQAVAFMVSPASKPYDDMPFDLVLYDMNTRKNTVLLKGTETLDYTAIGWLDDQTISYRMTIYRVEDKNLHGQEIKYLYDVSSKETKAAF